MMQSKKLKPTKILLNILVIIGLGLTLFISTKILSITNKGYHEDPSLYLYGEGNASPEARREILDQLRLFQKGYEERDTLKLEPFMEQLFSREDVLVLGTMPGEIYQGFTEATDLVSSDWLYWGDVMLQMDNANISARDSVAWISTIGTVEFDLSRFLTLPLRFTGVLVKEGPNWKFQQLQFQFDLDTSWVLGAIILLSLMLLVSIIRLLFLIIRAAHFLSSSKLEISPSKGQW